MTTALAILTRAQALADDDWRCAHIAISDANFEPVNGFDPERSKRAQRIYASANGLDPTMIPLCIHKFWDAATPEERTASWQRAAAAAMGEG